MSNPVNKGKTASIVAYLTIVGALIAMSMNSQEKNPYARFHIRQAFGIHLFYIAMGILISNSSSDLIPASVLFLVYLIMWGHGFWNAIQGKMVLTPYIGTYFQKWFTFIN